MSSAYWTVRFSSNAFSFFSNMYNIPFAQYNVLSSSLCEPTWYTESPAQDLPGEVRLPRVLAKLQAQIDASNGRVIIALQEVSMLWLGPLDAWFSERNK